MKDDLLEAFTAPYRAIVVFNGKPHRIDREWISPRQAAGLIRALAGYLERGCPKTKREPKARKAAR